MKVGVRVAMSFRLKLAPSIGGTCALRRLGEQAGPRVGVGEIRSDLPALQSAWVFVGHPALLFVQHWGSGGAWPTLDEIPQLVVTRFFYGAAHAAPRRAPLPRP